MKKFEGILFCTDIDGTLVDGAAPISSENKKAIKYFMDNGGYFTACTGRQVRGVRSVLEELEANAPAICYNGAWIHDIKSGKDLRVLPLEKDMIPRALDLIEANPDIIHVIYSMNVKGKVLSAIIKLNRETGGYDSIGDFCCDMHFDTRKELLDQMEGAVVYKALFFTDPENSDAVKESVIKAFPDCAVHRSWIRGIEINVPGACKGPSARYVANLLGASFLVCSGDYENDMTMIVEADIGYAVGNGIEMLKAAADRIAPPCTESAIAHIVYELERDIDSGKIKIKR